MKLSLPAFPKASRKRKLRATAARRAGVAETDFEEMGEPNMKLSRALLIVLVLHVVAVAGIIAFNAIKSRQLPAPALAPRPAIAATPTASVPAVTATPTTPHELKPRGSASPVKNEKRAKAVSPPPVSGRSYTVAKGDTPMTIARKFKVPFDDLLAANHIEDPRKLRIGQKLIIPAKAKARKGSD